MRWKKKEEERRRREEKEIKVSELMQVMITLRKDRTKYTKHE